MDRPQMVRYLKSHGYKNLNTRSGLIPVHECKESRLFAVCELVKKQEANAAKELPIGQMEFEF